MRLLFLSGKSELFSVTIVFFHFVQVTSLLLNTGAQKFIPVHCSNLNEHVLGIILALSAGSYCTYLSD